MWARIKRWRWSIAIAALVLLGLTYSFWPERIAVDLAEVDRGPMAISITDDGVTRVRDLYTVSAPVSGYINRIDIDPGDPVVAGSTIIARIAPLPSSPIDPRTRAELANALRAAKAARTGAEAALKLARNDLQRAEALFNRGFLPRAQLEAARTAEQTRTADVAQARAEIGRLRATMSAVGRALPSGGGMAVRSPESGVLLLRLIESEGAVTQGTPLVEIGDPARIEVVLDLLSRDAARIEPGDEVRITHWGGDEYLPGRVQRVEPFGRLKVSALGIEEQRVDVIVEFESAAAARISALGHGYQLDGTVILWRDDNALRVPVGAIFRSPAGDWQLFVAQAGRAQLRAVKIGHINDEFAEVLEGIEEGEQVVLDPSSTIADGARIKAR